jgi:hypothetical protein
MIYLGFNITNPWGKRWANVWNRVYATPFKNKFLELELFKDTTILSFSLRWAIRQSHAGLMIDAGLLGYSINFNFYDNRHWNSEQGRWMIYTGELGEH